MKCNWKKIHRTFFSAIICLEDSNNQKQIMKKLSYKCILYIINKSVFLFLKRTIAYSSMLRFKCYIYTNSTAWLATILNLHAKDWLHCANPEAYFQLNSSKTSINCTDNFIQQIGSKQFTKGLQNLASIPLFAPSLILCQRQRTQATQN